MLIQLKQITRIYEVGIERVNALKGIDLEIDNNEYVAIMGPSGSGKSTLMNLLGCLDRATSGMYLLNGHNTTDLSSNDMAQIRNQQIGFVFQSFELLPRQNALKNVELPLIYTNQTSYWERGKLAKAALERVGLGKRYTHHPNQLSGGEKQRVAIARALVNNPSLLLADEPTGNLDSRTGKDIMEIFDQLHKDGQTIIMVTHEEEIAQYAQRIISMRDGMIQSDTPLHMEIIP